MISASIDRLTRKEVYRRDGFRCALCDSPRYLQIHHAIPRSGGGNGTEHNLITLCSDCHALAHGTDLRDTGIEQRDVEQAIVEYLADFYAPDWDPYTHTWWELGR